MEERLKMPNYGPTTVLPSPTGGGLTRAAESFWQTFLAARDLKLRRRALELEETKEARAERLTDLQLALAMSTFLPEGATLGEYPTIARKVKEALGPDVGPDIDPIQWNPKDLAGVLNILSTDFLEGLPEADRRRVLQGQVGLTGTERSRELREETEVTQLEGLVEGLRLALSDPDFSEEFARKSVGLEGPHQFSWTDPRTGVTREYRFTTDTAAQVWGALQRITVDSITASLSARLGWERLRLEERERARQELYKLAESLGVGLTQSLADQMLNAYEDFLDPETPRESSKFQSLFDHFKNKYETEGDRDALDAMVVMRGFNNLVRNGMFNFYHTMGESAPGRAIIQGLALNHAITEVGGKEFGPAQTGRLLDQLDDMGFSFGLTDAGFGRFIYDYEWQLDEDYFNTPRVEGPRDPGMVPGPTENPLEDPSIMRKVSIAAHGLKTNSMSENQIRLLYGEDILQLAIKVNADTAAAGGGGGVQR